MDNRISEIIEAKGYKKKWVAKQMNISPTVLSRWITGKNTPSLEKAFQLAQILDCKVDDLYEVKK